MLLQSLLGQTGIRMDGDRIKHTINKWLSGKWVKGNEYCKGSGGGEMY